MCRKKERKKTTVVFFLPSLLVSLFGLALVSPYVILHLILLFYLYFTLYFLNSFLSLSYGVYGVYLSFPLQLVAGGTFFFSFCSSGGTKGRRQRATRPHTRILNSLPNFTSARPPRPKANVSICQCKWERERPKTFFQLISSARKFISFYVMIARSPPWRLWLGAVPSIQSLFFFLPNESSDHDAIAWVAPFASEDRQDIL